MSCQDDKYLDVAPTSVYGVAKLWKMTRVFLSVQAGISNMAQ